jgi:hypothetical protein
MPSHPDRVRKNYIEMDHEHIWKLVKWVSINKGIMIEKQCIICKAIEEIPSSR